MNDVLDVDAFFLARFGNFDLLQVARDVELIRVVAATGRKTRFNQLDIARPGRQTSENEEKGVPSLGHLRRTNDCIYGTKDFTLLIESASARLLLGKSTSEAKSSIVYTH